MEARSSNSLIRDKPGGCGMAQRRWAFMAPFQVGRHFDRLRLIQTPWFGIYLHVIHQPDADPDPHNHPWHFASLVLSGGYTEHVWDKPGRLPEFADEKTHRRGSLHLMRRSQAHRIAEVHGLLWTLFLTGPRAKKEWGWWVIDEESRKTSMRAELVPWHVYRGIDDPARLLAERSALWGS